MIPFDVQTVRNQTTKVKQKHHEEKVSDHNAFFCVALESITSRHLCQWLC